MVYKTFYPHCSCGDPTRTNDLWVMSPTSYQLLHSAMFFSSFLGLFINKMNVFL